MPLFVETVHKQFTVSSPTTEYVYELLAPQRGELVRFDVLLRSGGSMISSIDATLMWGTDVQPANNASAHVYSSSEVDPSLLPITTETISSVGTRVGGYLTNPLPYSNPVRGFANTRSQYDQQERLYLKLSSSGNFSGTFEVLLVIRAEYA